MNKKIYVVGGATHYASFIDDYTLVDNVQDADIILFTGGEDVHPSLYNENIHFSTFTNFDRDAQEMEIFNSIPVSKKVIGICRGLTCGSR